MLFSNSGRNDAGGELFFARFRDGLRGNRLQAHPQDGVLLPRLPGSGGSMDLHRPGDSKTSHV